VPSRRAVRCLALLAALAFVLSAGKIRAQSAEALYAEGLQARRAGDFPQAVRLLEQARQLEPENADLALLLGSVLGFERRFAEARAVLEPALRRYPDYVDLRIQLARIQAFEKEFALAEKTLAPALAVVPPNAEAHELAGRIAYYRNDLDAAATAFERAHAMASKSLDALVGLGDVARARGDEDGARAWWLEAQAVDPGSRDVADRLAQRPADDQPPWRIDAGGSWSTLSRGDYDDWYEAFLQLGRQPAKNRFLWARSEWSERFSQKDLYLEMGFARRFDAIWAADLAVGGAPTANVRETFAVRGGGSARLTGPNHDSIVGPLSTTGRTRLAWYGSTRVATLAPGLSLDLWSGRATVAGEVVGTDNDSDGGNRTVGWNVRFDVPPAEVPWGLGVGYADAPDTVEGETREAQSIFGHVSYALDDRHTVRLDLAREDRDRSYRRTTVALAVSVRF
jgi:YaiO family outer membrane protein